MKSDRRVILYDAAKRSRIFEADETIPKEFQDSYAPMTAERQAAVDRTRLEKAGLKVAAPIVGPSVPENKMTVVEIVGWVKDGATPAERRSRAAAADEAERAGQSRKGVLAGIGGFLDGSEE